MQYLGDNIGRARAHWREALSALADLQRLHSDNEAIAELGAATAGRRMDSVLPRLELEAIPRPTNKAAIHLAAVVETIHDCEHLAATARTKLNLQRMRAD